MNYLELCHSIITQQKLYDVKKIVLLSTYWGFLLKKMNREVILEILCPYLAPTELFNVSLVSKRVRSSISRSLVLESIMYHGKASSIQLIHEIMKLVKAGKIHTPSAARLLRLAAAKTCEIRKSYCDGRVVHNGSHLEYGVFCCKSCVHLSTTQFKHRTKRDGAIVGPALESTRTCMWKGGVEAYMWTTPVKSRDNECIGPLITVNLMKRLKLENPLQSLQESFDQYLKESEEMKETDPESPEVKKLIQLFDRIERDASKFRIKVEKRKFEEKEQRVLAKRAKAGNVEERLLNLVGDLGISKEIWSTSSIYKRIIEPFKKAPSKATKKALSEAAETIKEYFGHVPADFFEFKFLDQIEGEFARCLKVAMSNIGSSFFTDISPYQLALIKLNLNAEALIFSDVPFGVFEEYAKGSGPNFNTSLAELFFQSKCSPICKSLSVNILESRISWGSHVSMTTAMDQIKRNLPIIRDSLFEKSFEPILEQTKKEVEEAHEFMEELLKFDWYTEGETGREMHLRFVDLNRDLFWNSRYGGREYLEHGKSFSHVFAPINRQADWIYR